jgi:lipoprotein-anchoring transpeptidase ErfK/SrfK
VSPGSSGRPRSRASASAAAIAAALVTLALPPAPNAAPAAQPREVPAAGYLAWPRVAARAQPHAQARVVRVVAQFDSRYRPRVVLALGVRLDDEGRPAWYRISLPGRPNGRTAWVRAHALELKPVRRSILIDRSARTLTLREGGRVVFRTRVAVGARGMETPLGTFYVTRKFRPNAPILGAFALETSAYSKLSEWPGGGIVGIHGTNQPWLLGRAVSHGCVRVANAQILKLARLTPAGTPIRIVP